MKKASKIILLNSNNEVLLQLRSKGQSNEWMRSLFGGHIDEWETPDEALVREIKEELNYDLTEFTMIKMSIVEEFWEVYRYTGLIDSDLSKLTLQEWDEMRFFNYQEIKTLKVSPNSKQTIIEYFEESR